MSATTVIVISILITLVVLFASVWVVVKGYAYKHTIDSDDEFKDSTDGRNEEDRNNGKA